MSFENVQQLLNISVRLDTIRRISPQLARQPGARAEELVTVLEEVSKTFNAFEGVLLRLLSLTFTESARERSKAELVALEGGAPRALVGQMRARCGKIEDLYRDVLVAWFNSADISDDSRLELEQLFFELGESDANVIVPAVEQLVGWLESQVDNVSTLVESGQFEAANRCILEARKQVRPIRREIGSALSQLQDLELQFTS